MVCMKCNNHKWKHFDEDFLSCMICGTLKSKAVEPAPAPRPITPPKGTKESSDFTRRIVESKWDQIVALKTRLLSWPEVTKIIQYPYTYNSLRACFNRMANDKNLQFPFLQVGVRKYRKK